MDETLDEVNLVYEDGVYYADLIELPLLAEVSHTCANARLSFPAERILSLARSFEAEWSTLIDYPQVLYLDKTIDSKVAAQNLGIDERSLPIVCLIEGETRVRALTAIHLHMQTGDSLESCAEICSRTDFINIKKKVAAKKTEEISIPVGLKYAYDIQDRYALLSYMVTINDKKPYTIIEQAQIVQAMLPQRDITSNDAFPTYNDGVSLRDSLNSLQQKLTSLSGAALIDPKVWSNALYLLYLSDPLKDAYGNNTLTEDNVLSIAKVSIKNLKQLLKNNRMMTPMEVSHKKAAIEAEWVSKFKEDYSTSILELKSALQRLDARYSSVIQKAQPPNKKIKTSTGVGSKLNTNFNADKTKKALKVGIGLSGSGLLNKDNLGTVASPSKKDVEPTKPSNNVDAKQKIITIKFTKKNKNLLSGMFKIKLDVASKLNIKEDTVLDLDTEKDLSVYTSLVELSLSH